MNWEIVGMIILGVVLLYTATVEGEFHKWREDKKWKTWANKNEVSNDGD